MSLQYVVKLSDKMSLNEQSKVNLPQEYLEKLIEDEIVEESTNCFCFEIKNEFHTMYCCCLEFTAEEETVEIPFYMVNQNDTLVFETNDMVTITYIPKIQFCKFLQLEPLVETFFSQPEYETFLEKELSKISLLYENQIFYIFDSHQTPFPIKVKQIQPDWDNVNICDFHETNQSCFLLIDQDVNVDIVNQFKIDRYYQEQKRQKQEKRQEAVERSIMKKEDFNNLSLGQQISSTSSTNMSLEEIRERRLQSYLQKKMKK